MFFPEALPLNTCRLVGTFVKTILFMHNLQCFCHWKCIEVSVTNGTKHATMPFTNPKKVYMKWNICDYHFRPMTHSVFTCIQRHSGAETWEQKWPQLRKTEIGPRQTSWTSVSGTSGHHRWRTPSQKRGDPDRTQTQLTQYIHMHSLGRVHTKSDKIACLSSAHSIGV